MDDEDLEQKVKRIRLTENSIKSEVKKKLDRERKKRKDQKNRSREKEKRIELKDKKGNNDNTVIHESSSISKHSAIEVEQVSLKLNQFRESSESLPPEVIIQQQKAMISIVKELKSGSRLERRKAAFDKITKKSVDMLTDTKLKAPKKKTVLEKMESNSTKSGPLKVLYNSVKEGYKIKVWIRRYNGLRGVISGYLVAFDFHMNLAMIDVCELFTIESWMIGQPVKKTKIPESKKTIVHSCSYIDAPKVTSNPIENIPIQKQTSTTIYLKSLAEKLKGGSKSAVNIGKDNMDSKDLTSSLNQKSAFIFDEKALSHIPSNNLSETDVAVKTNILKAPSEAVVTLKSENPYISLKDFSPTIWSILQSVTQRKNQNPCKSEVAEKSVSDSSYSLVNSMLELLQTRAEVARGTETVQKSLSDAQTGDSADLSQNQLKNKTTTTVELLQLPCGIPSENTATFPTLSLPLSLNSESSPLPPKFAPIPCNVFTTRQKIKASASTSFPKSTKDGKSTQEEYKMSNKDENLKYSDNKNKYNLEYEHQKSDKLVYEDSKNDFVSMLKETDQQTSQEPFIENMCILKSECLDSNQPIKSHPCDPRTKNFAPSEISVSKILPTLFVSSPKMNSIPTPSLENKTNSKYFVPSFPNTNLPISLTNPTDGKHLTKRKQTSSPSYKSSKDGIASQSESTVLSDSDESTSEFTEILSQVCTITTFRHLAQSEVTDDMSSRLKVSSNVLGTGKLLNAPNVVLKHESSDASSIYKQKFESSNSVNIRKLITNRLNNKPTYDQNEEIKEEESSFMLNLSSKDRELYELSSNPYPNHSVSFKTKSGQLNCNFIFHSIGKRLHEKKAKYRHHLEGKTISSSLIKITPWFEADNLKSQFSSSDDDLKENNYCEVDSSVYSGVSRYQETRRINPETLNHLNKPALINESSTHFTTKPYEDFSNFSLSLNSPFLTELQAKKDKRMPLPDNYSSDSLIRSGMSENLLITPVQITEKLAEYNFDRERLTSDSQYGHVPTVCNHFNIEENMIGAKKQVLPGRLQHEENKFINSEPDTDCVKNGNNEIIFELIESLLTKVCKNICESETDAINIKSYFNVHLNTSPNLNTFGDSFFPDFNAQTAVKENLQSMMELKKHQKNEHQITKPFKLSVKVENYLVEENESEKAHGDDVKNSISSCNRVKFKYEKKGEPQILSNDKLQERKLKEDGEITESESDYGALDKISSWKIGDQNEEKLKSKDNKTSKQKNGKSISDETSISDGKSMSGGKSISDETSISDGRSMSGGRSISDVRNVSDGRSIPEETADKQLGTIQSDKKTHNDKNKVLLNRDELISDESEKHKFLISREHFHKTKTNRDRDKEKLIELSDRESLGSQKSHRHESRQQDDKKSHGKLKKDDSSSREKSKTSDSSSREKSKKSESSSREKSKKSDSSTREKSKRSDSSTREKSKRSDNSSREKSKRSDSSTREKSKRSDSSSREKSKRSDSSTREKSKRSDSSTREKSKRSDNSSREKSKRSDSSTREKSKRSDSSSREKSKRSDSSSREKSKRSDSSTREKSKRSDSSTREKSPSNNSLKREKMPFTRKIPTEEKLSAREKSYVGEKSLVHNKLSLENCESHKSHRNKNSQQRSKESHEKSRCESRGEKSSICEKSSDREKSSSREKIPVCEKPFVPRHASTDDVITESKKNSLVKNMKSPGFTLETQRSEFRFVDEKCMKSLASKAEPDLNIFQQRNQQKSAQIKRKLDERDGIAINNSTSKIASSITFPQRETIKTNLKHSSPVKNSLAVKEGGFLERRSHYNHELQENTRTEQLLKFIQPFTFIPDNPKKGLIYKKRYVNQLFVRGDNIIMVAYDKST